MEARGEKINVSSGPIKEIEGLKKMMMKMMTPGSQDLCVEFITWNAITSTASIIREAVPIPKR